MLLLVILLIIAVWALAWLRAPLWAWTAVIAVFLASATYAGNSFSPFWRITWLLFLAAAVILNVPALRRKLLIRPILSRFRRMAPPISRTEREALEAGTVWWDGELFSGTPDWKRLLSMPEAHLTEEEKAFLSGPVEEICRMLDDWRLATEYGDLPPEVWQFIRKNGFFGLIIPGEYGGKGFSAFAHSEVIQKIASRSYAAAVTVMVPNSLGPAELLLHYGTQEQKAYYLPRLARGEEIPCFALTAPEAGSDAASIPDSGVVCKGNYAGQETLGILLNWEKRYITLGPVATVIGLAFRLLDPDHLVGDRDAPGITLALIPVNTPGITIGSRHDPLGIPFQNGPTSGADVFVPIDCIIGGISGIGQGWKMLMEGLAAGRSISLPALSTGAAKLSARAVGAYAGVRRQFRLPIGRFEGIEEPLARIAGNTYLMDAARTVTCAAVDAGERPSVISGIVKQQCTERMRSIMNDSMDIMGGYGISMGPRNLIGRYYQAAPIGITVEGANILTRTMIIFGQGVIRCHPYILKEMQAAAKEGVQGVEEFDTVLGNHAAFTLSNAARSLFHGLTGGLLIKAPSGPLRRYFQASTRLSTAFALAADTALLTLGGSLKRREKLSGRLADVLSNLYLISTLLKRFEEREWPNAELPLVIWGCRDSLVKIQESLEGLMRNLPSRPTAWLLRLCIFPLGRAFAGPDDILGRRVAATILEPSEARDRLTSGIFLPVEAEEPLERLEDALRKVVAAEPVERILREAVKNGDVRAGSEADTIEAGFRAGVISRNQAEKILLALEARKSVIKVDDFPVL